MQSPCCNGYYRATRCPGHPESSLGLAWTVCYVANAANSGSEAQLVLRGMEYGASEGRDHRSRMGARAPAAIGLKCGGERRPQTLVPDGPPLAVPRGA
jgi:hypothetical protein